MSNMTAWINLFCGNWQCDFPLELVTLVINIKIILAALKFDYFDFEIKNCDLKFTVFFFMTSFFDIKIRFKKILKGYDHSNRKILKVTHNFNSNSLEWF